jgi:hypothetical protein
MWVEFKRVKGLKAANMWKKLYEGEGLPIRLLTERIEYLGDEFADYKICVPRSREHVAEEIERKV